MLKTKFEKLSKPQKILLAAGLILIGVLLFAVIVGILNAYVGDGEWSLWSSYKYDETGYEVGSSSVGSKQITAIDIDWIDGDVELLLCDDAYISVTELYEGDLPDSALLRYKLSEDGTALSVKYRSSDAFIGFGSGGENKKLIVRVPRTYIDQLRSITVNGKNANVKINGVSAREMNIYTKSGNIELNLPQSVGYWLSFECKEDEFYTNIPNLQNSLGHGDCTRSVVLRAPRGSVRASAQTIS